MNEENIDYQKLYNDAIKYINEISSFTNFLDWLGEQSKGD